MNTSQATYDRLKAMQRAEERASEMAKRVSEQARKPQSQDERVRDSLSNTIDEIRDRLRSAPSPDEKARLYRRLDILTSGHAEVDTKINEDKRIAKFRADHGYQNAKTHFEGFSKTPAAPVSEEDISLCGAILNSTEWENPGDAVAAYWGEVQRVEQTAYEKASKVAADKRHEALKAELDAANASVAAKQREQAVAQARANSGANDASSS